MTHDDMIAAVENSNMTRRDKAMVKMALALAVSGARVPAGNWLVEIPAPVLVMLVIAVLGLFGGLIEAMR